MFSIQLMRRYQPSRLAKALWIGVSLLLITIQANSAHAQELWRGATVGMTQKQVQSLFPGAAFGSHERVASGATEELRAEEEIAGAPFTANFYFRNDGLLEIVLDRAEIMNTRPADAHNTFVQMREDFARAYGPASNCQVGRNINMVESCDWESTSTSVTLIHFDVQDQPLLLKAIFRKPSDPGRR